MLWEVMKRSLAHLSSPDWRLDRLAWLCSAAGSALPADLALALGLSSAGYSPCGTFARWGVLAGQAAMSTWLCARLRLGVQIALHFA